MLKSVCFKCVSDHLVRKIVLLFKGLNIGLNYLTKIILIQPIKILLAAAAMVLKLCMLQANNILIG